MKKFRNMCIGTMVVCLSLLSLSDSALAVKKRKWTKEEDQKLLCIVNLKDDFGKINWTEVSNQMIDRNPRQCRERYKHYLLPDLSKADWSQEEDQRLLYEVEISGKKWTEISKSFAGRTSIGLKNRYSLLLRRKKAIMYGKKNIAEKKVDIIKSTPLPDQDYIAMDFFKDNDVENNVEGAFVDDFDWEI